MNDSEQNSATGVLRIATCPVNWNNNDLPGWRPLIPFPEILDHMREAGYRATEYDGSFGSDPDALTRAADARGLQWTGSYQWVDFLDSEHLEHAIQSLKPTLEVLEAIGCGNLVVADSLRPDRVALAGRVPADGSASLSMSEMRRLIDGVHRVADVARDFGLAVRYHNHVGTWIEAPHELDALISEMDTNLADLCFDTGHYAYGGGNPSDFIRHHHEIIGYLHLKDVDERALTDARQRQLSFLDALREYVFSPIGTGSADIPAILRVLTDHHYAGWIVVEQDTCEGDATETAKSNLDFIANWLVDHINVRGTGR